MNLHYNILHFIDKNIFIYFQIVAFYLYELAIFFYLWNGLGNSLGWNSHIYSNKITENFFKTAFT